MGTYKALLIPVDGPIQEIEIDEADSLATLQKLVGGLIQALPWPRALRDWDRATVYVNEEGKYTYGPEGFNGRATDVMLPGIGLRDYVAGPMVVAGFDYSTGEHTPEIPDPVARRVRLVAQEAGL